jgi:hypothetical protein
VLIQIVTIIDGVPVSRAVGMNVGDFVRVRGRLWVGMTASKAVMIEARFLGCAFRRGDERRLERERNHCRHHDSSSETCKQ